MFVKGQSGNPGGRAKTKPITDAIKVALKAKPHNGKATNLALIVSNLIQTAQIFGTSESIAAAKLILAYVEGQPTQPIEIDVRSEAEKLGAEYGIEPGKIIELYGGKRRAG